MKDTKSYHSLVQRLREFFLQQNFLEVPVQSRLSILAACEDPYTVSKFEWEGEDWPLPQTGQMWLEHELLKNPNYPGVFCISTSYRNEPNPVPGRHDKIFPMFEFELKGDMNDLRQLEIQLLEFLGFSKTNGEYPKDDYDTICKKYNVDELEHEHEEQLEKDYGSVFFLENFPERTSPFWNMKLQDNGTHSNKIDVILHGIETIGSAERSCSPEEMKDKFHTISDGGYADILYTQFSKERVEKELNDFTSNKFFKRSGGGIGMTRMIRAMKFSNLIE